MFGSFSGRSTDGTAPERGHLVKHYYFSAATGCSLPYHGLSVLSVLFRFITSQVSREFQSLAQEKTFWIHLLRTARETLPLPCADDEDFWKKDISILKRLVFHIIRRERNWSRPTAHIKAVKTLELGQGHNILHSIPGTPFVVIHSEHNGAATCWDLDAGLDRHSIYIGRSVFYISLGMCHNGTHSIALLVTDDLAVEYMSR